MAIRNLTPSTILEQVRQGRTHGQFDAVVLFVDTSGFTPLTTHLTEQGNEGAEILADVLYGVFEPLIEAVYRHGGFVAGFAGDAFKAIFPTTSTDEPGENKTRADETGIGPLLHALAAAVEIRHVMAEHPSQQTRYGSFDFIVRTSLASGAVHWAIWAGEAPNAAQSHGYTFSGPALDAAIAGEDHATGGELVVTEDVYRALLAAQPESVSGEVLTGDAGGYIRINTATDTLPAPLAPIEQATADLADASLFDPALFYPAALLNTETRGEFRPVFTVFLNVQTLPDPGTEGDFLPLFFQLLHQYGGYLCRIGRIGANDPGGTFLLFWGAPTGYENNLQRALNFLLEFRARVDVPMRAGMTHDVVYAGFVGASWREEYTCYGSSVNTAARQMGVAEWGQILLDAETARRAQDEFRLVLAGRYTLKGLVGEQSLFALQAAQREEGTTDFASGFVGRTAELEQLQAAVRPVLDGHFGGLTLVRGEAGMGKSRLVHETLARLAPPTDGDTPPPMRILFCETDEILREALNPFRYGLLRYFDLLPGSGEEIGAENRSRFDARFDALLESTVNKADHAELHEELVHTRSFLAALLGLRWADSDYENAAPRDRGENTLAAIKAFIRAESLRQPLLLVLEDVQWLDSSTRAFLPQLLHNMERFPFALLATTRPTDPANALPSELITQQIDVAELASTDLSQLTQEQLGGPASAGLNELLLARTGGNPFFVEQLLLYLQERNLLVAGADGWQLTDAQNVSNGALPTDLQTVLVARLDRLTQEVRTVVQTAAVLGREFSVQVLSQMLRNRQAAHIQPLQDNLHAAQESAVWEALSELRYLFRHALLRDAAYDMQLRAQRRALHRVAAEAIETLYGESLGGYYTDLVHHYRQCEDATRELHYARLAAADAASRYANADAIFYYSRALDLLPDTISEKSTDDGAEGTAEEEFELRIAREAVTDLIGNHTTQWVDLERLQALVADTQDVEGVEPTQAAKRAQVALRLTKYHEERGDFVTATNFAMEAVQFAQRGQAPELEAMGHFRWCISLWKRSDYAGARERAQASLQVARANGLRRLEAHAIMQLGNSDFFYGRYEDSRAHYEESLPIYTELNEPRNEGMVLGNIGLIARALGDYQEALRFDLRALEKHRQVGHRRGLAGTLLSLGTNYTDLRQFDQAPPWLAQALAVYREMSNLNGEMLVMGGYCTYYRLLGDYATAESYNESGQAMARQLGNRRAECIGYLERSVLCFVQQQHEEALAAIEQSTVLADELGLPGLRTGGLNYLGHALYGLGRTEEAMAAYQEAITTHRGDNQTHLAMESLSFLTLIHLDGGELETALGYANEMNSILDTDLLHATTDPINIYWACYRTLHAAGDDRATGILASAHARLQREVATIDNEAQRYFFLNNIASHAAIGRAYEDH